MNIDYYNGDIETPRPADGSSGIPMGAMKMTALSAEIMEKNEKSGETLTGANEIEVVRKKEIGDVRPDASAPTKKSGGFIHPSETAMFTVPVVSVTDATGITQRLPDSEQHEEAIDDIYPAPVSGKVPIPDEGLPTPNESVD